MDSGSDGDVHETLAQTTRQTRERFTLVIQALGTSGSATTVQDPKEALEDAFERFQLWIGSVGAAMDAQSKMSLEWRLRDAPEIKERIVELQNDINEALEDLHAIATGQRNNRTRAADTVDLDPGSDSDADSVGFRFEVDAVNEAQDILEVVLDCVKDLLRLSILIRKATPRDRWTRALQKPKDDQLDDRFDIRHVGEKFPKLCRPEHDWLKHRLGRAITQRREFIRYCREHKNRMQALEIDDRMPTTSGAEQFGLITSHDVPEYAQTATALTFNPPVTEGSTHASTLHVTNLEAIRGGDDDDDTASVATSVVSSIDPEDESEELLQLPSLQAVSQGHDEFECPLCSTIQSFRQHRKWKKHAYIDLKPYVCCGGKGECDLELFSSRNTWFTHELESHRHHYICFLCQREPLTSLARFRSHVQNQHVEIPVGQIHEVAQLCKRPLQFIPAINCPFCDEFEAKLRERGGTAVGDDVVVVPAVLFRRHVASHLEQLALFSLGPQDQSDKEVEEGSFESRSAGSARDADMLEHFLNDPKKFEQENPVPSDIDPDLGLEAKFDPTAELRSIEARAVLPDTASLSPNASATEEHVNLDGIGPLNETKKKSSRDKEWKDMLSRALQMAKNAVLLDNAQNFGGAIEAYTGTCKLLEQVIARNLIEDDRRKLDHILVTYTNRIDELRQLDPGHQPTTGKDAMTEGRVEVKGNDEVERNRMTEFEFAERREMEKEFEYQPKDDTTSDIGRVPTITAVEVDDITKGAEEEHKINEKPDTHSDAPAAALPSVGPKLGPIVRALFDFEPSEPGELRFRKDDIITVSKPVYKDWWSGSLRGQTGIFPLNYVETTMQDGERLPKMSFVPEKPDVLRVQALYDFQPLAPDELQLEKGDIIEVLGSAYKDWWKGTLRGQTGIFPLNYVEKLPDPHLPSVSSMVSPEIRARIPESGPSIPLSAKLESLAQDEEQGKTIPKTRQAKQEIAELQSKLAQPSGEPVEVDFNLLSREVLHRGNLWRKDSLSLHQVYVILFDNYLVIADPEYVVLYPPIPVNLLVLESLNDEPSSFDVPGTAGKQTLFPFRVTILGKETYTFLASSLDEWKIWCDKIIQAKTTHAASLYGRDAEPFMLRVLANSTFAYESNTQVQAPEIQAPVIKGTTLARALEAAERFPDQDTICRAKVNCATTYTLNSIKVIAVGTDTGVYVNYANDITQQWIKLITIPKVTQVSVLPAFSLFLLLSHSSLIAYPLDFHDPQPNIDAASTAPQKLTSGRNVQFITSGRMKDRELVFHACREGLGTTFKVLEPIFQKTEKKSRSRFFKRSNREMFREYDEFYIPAFCSRLNVFNTTLAIHTPKGFEIMSLDKKQMWAVPDLKHPAVAEIGRRIQNQTPLGMFRLDTQEFICCYNESAVYIDQHGDISRSVIMEYISKANSATLRDGYLLLFHDDFIEIRDVQNGRLKQIVEGKDIKCLDDGDMDKRNVKMVMRHPKNGQFQVVLELVIPVDVDDRVNDPRGVHDRVPEF